MPVILNTEVTKELVEQEQPDVIIAATGVTPIIPKKIPGVDKDLVVLGQDVLSSAVNTGQRVVVAGGGLVGEMLIVSMFNFPAEAFPIIATLGFIFDPAATCLNSSGDTIASMIVTRLVEGKDWLVKAVAAKKETA